PATAVAPTAAPATAMPTTAPVATTAPSAAPTQATAAGAQSGAPKTGGTLKLPLGTGSTADVKLNPLGIQTNGEGTILSVIYNGLVRMSPDWSTVEPELAEKWSISSDGRTYTFNLRKGVKWHDGQPFVAADVDFTYRMFLNK